MAASVALTSMLWPTNIYVAVHIKRLKSNKMWGDMFQSIKMMRALGLLLADGAPTVGRGKTF